MDEREIVARNIELYRKKANLSQLELAKKLNYSNKNISKWENAETTPSVFVLNKIAKLFGITVDDLLSEPTESKEEETEKKFKLTKRKKILFQISMLALANAILFAIGAIAVYILELVNVQNFNKWLIYLYLSPFTALSITIYVRVLYKYVTIIGLSCFGWLICLSVYLTIPNIANTLIFILGAAYEFLAIFIALLVDIKLSSKVNSIYHNIVNKIKPKKKEKKN